MTRLLTFFASGKATAALLAVIGGIAAWGSFLPSASAAGLFESKPFATVLALLFGNVSLGLIRPPRRRSGIQSYLIRLGALLVLLGAFLGRIYGQRASVQLYEGRQAGEFRKPGGAPLVPGFSLRLDRFNVERNPGGAPEIGISAGNDRGMLTYPVEMGRWTGPEALRVKPLRYLPDFKITGDGKIASKSPKPNNPALEIEVAAAGETERGWLFARFPHFPPVGLSRTLRAGRLVFLDGRSENVKSYASEVTILKGGVEVYSGTIEVNRPLGFNGYRIYQTAHDPVGWQWSGFELVRDPGLPFVYCGFAFLALGFTLWACLSRFN